MSGVIKRGGNNFRPNRNGGKFSRGGRGRGNSRGGYRSRGSSEYTAPRGRGSMSRKRTDFDYDDFDPDESFDEEYSDENDSVERFEEDEDGNIVAIPKRNRLKVAMQVLYMSKDSQDLAHKTLVDLRGSGYSIKKSKTYIDKGEKLKQRFWVQDRQLIVRGGINFGNTSDQCDDGVELKKLESIGFHKTRCVNALSKFEGIFESALDHLLSEAFAVNYSDFDLKDLESFEEEKSDEKTALESIYSEFKEIIPNRHWSIELDKNKFNKIFSKFIEKPTDPKAQTKLCPFFLKGSCKYGKRCSLSHKSESDRLDDRHLKLLEEEENANDRYYLNIRFPLKCIAYPLHTPLVYFSTTSKKVPPAVSLKITTKLMEEAIAISGSTVGFTIMNILEEVSLLKKLISAKDHPFSFSPDLVPDTFITSPMSHLSLDLGSMNQNSSKKSTNKFGSDYKKILDINSDLKKRYANKNKDTPMMKQRTSLPAWAERTRIIQALKTNSVLVVSGMTGCGKSTQVPQFIIDEWLENSDEKHCSVIVTQPRRISAVGVAERVAAEREEPVGSLVGYQIRLENKSNSKTRLLFMTTGILLRRLESDPDLFSVTHVIVDEVHERSEESDFLLLILRDLLIKRPNLKIILMSATLNSDLFASYFGDKVGSLPPPIIDIPGRTFPVKQIFLEEALEVVDYSIEDGSPYARPPPENNSAEWADGNKRQLVFFNSGPSDLPKEKKLDENLNEESVLNRYAEFCSEKIAGNISRMDFNKIDYDLIEKTLEYIHETSEEGSILIFLPGMAEICFLLDKLKSHSVFSKYNLLPLHGSLSSEEQSNIFVKKGPRKIVISTNLAETSITIEDCVYVIDAGKMKEKSFDPKKNMESLDTVWVSKANANQRKGRAGRVRPGVAFHLYTKFRYDVHFRRDPLPEIKRAPLERLVLRVKILPLFKERNLESVLTSLIEPPSSDGVSSALERLRSVSALNSSNELTPLGFHLANLPVDVKIGKLLIYGAMFRCLDSALTIASCLSFKSPISASSFTARDAVKKTKKILSDSSFLKSDQLVDLRAYNKWRDVANSSNNSKKGYYFAKENNLSYKSLTTLVNMKHSFVEYLSEIGFVSQNDGRLSSKKLDRMIRNGPDVIRSVTPEKIRQNDGNERVVLSILTAALYPNIVQILSPETKFKKTAAGAVQRPFSSDEVRFKTKDDGFVAIHPSSITFGIGDFSGSSYLAYSEKVKTSRIFIREISAVPAYSLILFGRAGVSLEKSKDRFVITMESGWIKFVTENQNTAELLKDMREELDGLLEKKISNPKLDLLSDPRGDLIIKTIIELINKE